MMGWCLGVVLHLQPVDEWFSAWSHWHVGLDIKGWWWWWWCPVYCRVFSSSLGFYSLEYNSTLCSCNEQTCLQTLPDVTLGGKIALVENYCPGPFVGHSHWPCSAPGEAVLIQHFFPCLFNFHLWLVTVRQKEVGWKKMKRTANF